MMSVHDALAAWQSGHITAATAMSLTGAADILELHAFSLQSGIAVRTDLLPREEEQARCATDLILRHADKNPRDQAASAAETLQAG